MGERITGIFTNSKRVGLFGFSCPLFTKTCPQIKFCVEGFSKTSTQNLKTSTQNLICVGHLGQMRWAF
jgi:hypothetical protein